MLTFPLDDIEYQADGLGAWFCTRTRGVFSGEEHFKVTPGGGMQVKVSKGLAWLKAEEFWGACALQKEEEILTVKMADGAYSRFDAVCIQLDKNSNLTKVVIKTGTPAYEPKLSPPVRNNNYDEIYVAVIAVKKGTISITAADIDDKRLDNNYCGVMEDGVTGIPTQELYDKWYDWFTKLELDANEKIKFLDEWIATFREQTGDDFNQWLADNELRFQSWMEGLGEQLGTEVGSALFGFAVEGNDLYLYYNNEADANRFSISEEGHLVYELDDEIAGIESTSLARMKEAVQRMDERVKVIEENDILSMIPKVGDIHG